MFSYQTLENTSVETLHQAFVSAFSDYQVKMDIPLWKFQQMLQRRGYVPEISMGAFNNEVLIGFTLNGFRSWNNMPTAYDAGTGVIPEYRKQGISNNIFQNIVQILKEKNIPRYLLEVLQSNAVAFRLYQKQGFGVTRSFRCFKLEKNIYKPRMNYNVEHVEVFSAAEWGRMASFWDVQPSWQNSIDSIKAVPDAFIYSVVRIDNAIVGYGIIDKKTGDIPQLAVDKSYRRKGIAANIASDLINNTESTRIAVINVDYQSQIIKDFCSELGFEEYVDQYEMILEL